MLILINPSQGRDLQTRFARAGFCVLVRSNKNCEMYEASVSYLYSQSSTVVDVKHSLLMKCESLTFYLVML